MQEEPCKQRQNLEQNVVDAVQQEYAAKEDALPEARIAERKAVKTLEDHIETHGCRADKAAKAMWRPH